MGHDEYGSDPHLSGNLSTLSLNFDPNTHIASYDCRVGFPNFIDAGCGSITQGICFHEKVRSSGPATGGRGIAHVTGGKSKSFEGMGWRGRFAFGHRYLSVRNGGLGLDELI